MRDSSLVMLTRAGPEIGVASTKAFTTQLTALGMLVVALAKHHGADAERERGLVTRLVELPSLIEKTLHPGSGDPQAGGAIRRQAARLVPGSRAHLSHRHGRRAEAQGDLLHSCRGLSRRVSSSTAPWHWSTTEMPVIAVAPSNDLLGKVKSNLMEVRARGGELIVFADPEAGLQDGDGVTVINMPRHVTYFQEPIIYTIPLQLLAYHVAILKGTDVDQPRNLAKSVTVE